MDWGPIALRALDPMITPKVRRQATERKALSRPVPAGTRIVVAGPTPRGGRTTVAALLALAFADFHGRRVLAVGNDLHPRLATRPGGSADTVLRGLRGDGGDPVGQRWLRQHLDHAGGPSLLASDPALGEPGFVPDDATLRRLGRWYAPLIVDTPVLSAELAPLIASAGHVVVVTPDAPAGADWDQGSGRVSAWLPWLQAITGDPARISGVLIAQPGARRRVPEKFLEIPHDPALATGGNVRWQRLSARTRAAVTSLAATVTH